MKIKWCVCILICLLLSLTATAGDYVDTRFESLLDQPEAEAIMALRGDIVRWINVTLEAENREKTYSAGNHALLREEDVDFGKMYKLYTFDPEIWKNVVSKSALPEMIQSCRAVWVYEHISGDVAVDVTISIAGPLTEELLYRTDEAGNRLLSDEQIKMLKNREGKWKVSSAAIGPKEDGFGNLFRQIAAETQTEEKAYFVSFPYLATYGVISVSENGALFHVLDKAETQNTGETVLRTYGQKQLISNVNAAVEELKSRPTHNENGNIIYYGMPEPAPLPLPEPPEEKPASSYTVLGAAAAAIIAVCGFICVKKASGRNAR